MSLIYAGLMSLLCYALTIIVPRVRVNPNCSSVSMPSANFLYWLPSVSFETLLFALTLFKCYQYQRLGWRRSPILRQFVRDGIWAFALIFAAMVAITVTYSVVRSPLTGVVFPWLWTSVSIVSARLILDLRRAFNQCKPTPRLSGIEIELPDTPQLPDTMLGADLDPRP